MGRGTVSWGCYKTPHPAAQLIFFGPIESETAGTMIFRNVEDYL